MVKSIFSKFIALTLWCGTILALSYCSGMSGTPEGSGRSAPIGGPVAAANDSGILAAPAEDDIMGAYSCMLPILTYGDGFAQSYKDKDFASWHIDTGNTFSGKFLLIGHKSAYKDIQIRVVYSDPSKTERRYRDFKFPDVPEAGMAFDVSVDGVSYGDFVEFFISPMKKVPTDEDTIGYICVPTALENFSEDWAKAGDENFEKTLGLLARFKIFTPIKKMEGVDRPEIPALEIDRMITP